MNRFNHGSPSHSANVRVHQVQVQLIHLHPLHAIQALIHLVPPVAAGYDVLSARSPAALVGEVIFRIPEVVAEPVIMGVTPLSEDRGTHAPGLVHFQPTDQLSRAHTRVAAPGVVHGLDLALVPTVAIRDLLAHADGTALLDIDAGGDRTNIPVFGAHHPVAAALLLEVIVLRHVAAKQTDHLFTCYCIFGRRVVHLLLITNCVHIILRSSCCRGLARSVLPPQICFTHLLRVKFC